MIRPNIYCQVCGMAMQCIMDFQKENNFRKPTVVEIGSAEGEGILRYGGFCQRVIAIDTMVSGRPDIFSKTKEDMKIDEGKLKTFEKNTQHRGYNVNLIVGSSSWKETLETLKHEVGQEGIDILVIDGAHHPEEIVQLDFDMYSPLVNVGGFVIFDDYYEKCINDVIEKVKKEGNYEVHDEFKINPSPNENIRQWCISLKKVS